MSRNIAACLSSKSDEWETPQALFDGLNLEFRFTLDAATNGSNSKCKKFFTAADDPLNRPWTGETVWLNPPFSSIASWMDKCLAECQENAVTICALVPSRTDSRWWHRVCLRASEIRYLKGRLKFSGAKNSAPFGTALVIFRPPRIGGPV